MKRFDLNIENEEDNKNLLKIGIALSSPIRIAILKQINNGGKTLSELAKLNYVSFSSIVFHVNLLEEAKLVRVKTIKINKTYSKYVIKGIFLINILFNDEVSPIEETENYQQEMKVGHYTKAEFGKNNGFFVDKSFFTFYENTPFLEKRLNADLIYTNKGFVEYTFDNSKIKNREPIEITFSLEICSEVAYYNNNYESLIGFSINGIEVASYLSPGDFGGRRGRYSPNDSSINATQYGQLKMITVNKNGVYLDGILLNNKITIDTLNLNENNCILFRVTSKEFNHSNGGFNIFGKKYGDFNQDIEMTITSSKKEVKPEITNE